MTIPKTALLNLVARNCTFLLVLIFSLEASAGPLTRKEEQAINELIQESATTTPTVSGPRGLQLRQTFIDPANAIFYAPRADHPYQLQMVHRASTPFRRGPRRVERIEVLLPWGLAKFEIDRVLEGVDLYPHYQWIGSLSETYYLLQRHPYLNDPEEFLNQAANFLAEVRSLPENAKQDAQLRHFVWNVNKAAEWARLQGGRLQLPTTALQSGNHQVLPEVFNDGFFSLVLGRRLLLNAAFREKYKLPTTLDFWEANGGDDDFDDDQTSERRPRASSSRNNIPSTAIKLRQQLDLALMQGVAQHETINETPQQIFERLAQIMTDFRSAHPDGVRYYQLPAEIRRFLGTAMALETFKARAFVNQYILVSLTHVEDAGTYLFTSMRPALDEDDFIAHHPTISTDQNRMQISPSAMPITDRNRVIGMWENLNDELLGDTQSRHRLDLFELMDRTEVINNLMKNSGMDSKILGFKLGSLQPFSQDDEGKVLVADIIAKIYSGVPANTVMRILYGFDPFLNPALTSEAWHTINSDEESVAWVRAQRAKAGVAVNSTWDFATENQTFQPNTAPRDATTFHQGSQQPHGAIPDAWQDYPLQFDEMANQFENEQQWARWVFQFDQEQILTPQLVSQKYRELLWLFHPDLTGPRTKKCAELLERDTKAMRAITVARKILFPN